MTTLSFDTHKAIEICRRNDVAMMGVFGSEVRGEATERSDIDLLVRFDKPKSLLSMVALEREMTEVLGIKVDLLTEASISPYLRERIIGEMQVIYEA